MAKIYTALGLMSGTSMDGVDASIIKSDGNREYSVKLDRYFDYGDELRQKLINTRAKVFKADHLEAYSGEIKDLGRELTLFHANAINEILNTTNIELDFVGFHGHTIFHDSKKKISTQLGDGKLLSQLTKKIVVYNFRQNDLKNEGNGAPLAPIFHNAIANKFLRKEMEEAYSINFLNIGGISNITRTVLWDEFLEKKKISNTIKACDIAPGNCLIDEWVRNNSKSKYDKNGELASSGKTNELVLNQALENFNIDLSYQESLDINDFNVSFAKGLSLENGAATITDFTAKLIADGMKYYHEVGQTKNNKWLVCGGGRKNKYLLKKIKDNFDNIIIDSIDRYEIDGDFIESQAFAYLAIRSFLKLPISFPSTTGCIKSSSGGVIVKNF